MGIHLDRMETSVFDMKCALILNSLIGDYMDVRNLREARKGLGK